MPVRRGGAGPRCRCVAVAALCAAAIGCGDRAEVPLVATVNDERITQADLDGYAAWRALDERGGGGSLDPAQERLQRLNQLRELIDRRLLLQVASRRGLSASDEEVEAVVARHRLPHANAEAFEQHLGSISMDVVGLRRQIRRQLTVERLLVREIASKVEVTELEMRAYYDANLAAFSVPEQRLHLAQILVGESQLSPIPNLRNDDATDRTLARRKIERILDELEDGADFEQLALHYSEDPVYAANGGDMGFIPLSALEKADTSLRRALVDLEPGDYSSIIETRGEFRILRLIAIEPAGQRSFDDPAVRDSIREVLANRKEQLLRFAFYEIQRNAARIRNYLAEGIAARHGVAR